MQVHYRYHFFHVSSYSGSIYVLRFDFRIFTSVMIGLFVTYLDVLGLSFFWNYILRLFSGYRNFPPFLNVSTTLLVISYSCVSIHGLQFLSCICTLIVIMIIIQILS
jgi:hypothetical protein